MGIRARYFLTAAVLIVFLIFLVTIVRFKRGTTAFANLENVKIKGPKDAPIHMVVYSDFQCPACLMALVPIEELRAEFSDQMQIEFRHFPLERPHKWALTAAVFAECAAEQGKFWEFHDRLFREQEIWSKSEDAIPFLARYAAELGMHYQNLEQCIADPKTLARVRYEHSTGEKLKVQSTPTISINGHLLVGGLQLKQQGKSVVIEELKRAGKLKEPQQA